jgi:hypothetical protein
MVVRRVEPVSLAKVAGVLYALLGLFFGALITLISMAGAFASDRFGAGSGGAGMLFGAGAVVLFPIMYGVFGFIFSLIGALLYNAVAGLVGGVEVEMQ